MTPGAFLHVWRYWKALTNVQEAVRLANQPSDLEEGALDPPTPHEDENVTAERQRVDSMPLGTDAVTLQHLRKVYGGWTPKVQHILRMEEIGSFKFWASSRFINKNRLVLIYSLPQAFTCTHCFLGKTAILILLLLR